MMKKRKVIKSVLLFIILFIILLLFLSTIWALNTFAFINFDEILFQLTSPIKSTESSILISFALSSFLPTIIISIITYLFIKELYKYYKYDKLNFKIKLFNKKLNFNIKTTIIKTITTIVIILISLFIIFFSLYKLTFINYIKSQMEKSKFIEENYIDPDNVKIKFPEKKRNLIYIYAESLESTYFSKDVGGESNYNYIAPLTNTTMDNINFSDTNTIGGAIGVPGTTWTTGAMVAHSAGIPLKINPEITNDHKVSGMLEGTTTLGDILEKEGYNQMLMIGSDKAFGNRGIYFKEHGNFKVYDYYTAIKKGKIPEDYYVWWGYEDSKLFEYAKEEVTKLSKKDKPFNFTMLTANTHTEDGYVESSCTANSGNHYLDSVSCSSEQIENFIEWIKNQDFYDNTTVILVGDHISMQPDLYPSDTKRRIYNVFINSAKKTTNNKNRMFTTMDLFPTTLSSLGVEIEGDKLGLGTDLFSDKKTLIEEIGEYDFNIEISKKSDFYQNNLLYNKKSTK